MLIVIKIGGGLLKNGLPENLVKDLQSLKGKYNFIIVHGGGDKVTELSTRLGHPPRFVVSPNGFRSRYTEKEESKIYTMVLAGLINKQIVSELESHGIPAVGMSGVDLHLIRASRKKQLIVLNEKGRKKLIEGGYTGKIDEINPRLLRLFLDNDITPVVAPVALGLDHELLNVDGDRVAASIASELQADTLLLLTDVKGVYLDDHLVSVLNVTEARKLMKDIGSGMITKVHAAIEAIENGIEEVIIASGTSDFPIKWSLDHKDCTVIKK